MNTKQAISRAARGLDPYDESADTVTPVTGPAPRPAAADLAAAVWLASTAMDNMFSRDTELRLATEVLGLAADLDETRRERDAARAALPDAGLLSRASAEVNAIAALHILPDGHPLCVLADSLAEAAAAIRALTTVPAPVPAADDAPDVPPFLAHRVNGGAM